MAKIHLKNLAHSYLPNPQGPEDFALKQLDIAWDDGGAYALLGPSGCGKTTLLNIISGLLHPSRGQVLFGDQDVTNLPTDKRNIAQVFQFPVVYDTMTVYQNLAFPLKNRGAPASEIDSRVRQMAEILELSDSLNRRAAGLTADAKQKISLGRGLVRSDVAAILFDEPLTVIDPHLKWQLRSQLKHLHREFDHTMIYVTHDQTEALTFADKVVVMYEGEVVQIGTPQDLFENPAHTFVGYFIGSPGMNVLPCELNGQEAIVAGESITLPAGVTPPSDCKLLELGVRPEFVRLCEPGESGLPVQVSKVEDVGRYRIVHTDLKGHDVKLMVPEGMPVPQEGVSIAFDTSRVNIYADSHLIGKEG
ncbi:ABC transporter ATP-binding protein [Rhodovibrionaceae bacterium A322]